MDGIKQSCSGASDSHSTSSNLERDSDSQSSDSEMDGFVEHCYEVFFVSTAVQQVNICMH